MNSIRLSGLSLLISLLLCLSLGCHRHHHHGTPSPTKATPPPADRLTSADVSHTRPNIVIILADDLGFGDLGCYNPNSKIPTPHLDQLAQKGMRFTDAHSPSSVCSPTRYGLLTGRYAWRTEMKSAVLWPWDRPLIQPDRMTIPKLLKQKGYHTTSVGKWHLGWLWPDAQGKPIHMPFAIGSNGRVSGRLKYANAIDYHQPVGGGPLGAGFDYYYGDDVINQPPYLWIENDRCLTQPTLPMNPNLRGGSSNGPTTPGWDQTKVFPALADAAIKQIDLGAKKRSPFFFYFALPAPHVPIMPTKPFIGRSQCGGYGDYVAMVDDVVGRVMTALKRHGIEDNTLVIFTSDNGSFYQSKTSGHLANGSWRGKKSDIWEGGHRVPMIVRWPHRVRPAINDQLVGVNDLLATIGDLTQHPTAPGEGEDSASLLPTLLDPNQSVRQTLVHHSGRGTFAIRHGDWKLILGKGSGGNSKIVITDQTPPGQLYHLKSDPAESRNLYHKHPALVEQLTQRLNAIKTSSQP